jgi:zinc-ribbon domain
MTCPKCGTANTDGVRFCTNCHATLIFKCPKCEHTQTHGGRCDVCGEDFALFWAQHFTKKDAEEARIQRDKAQAEALAVRTALTVPFSGPAGIASFLGMQLFSRLLAWYRSR